MSHNEFLITNFKKKNGRKKEKEREREREGGAERSGPRDYKGRTMVDHKLALLVSDFALDVFFQSSVFCLCVISSYCAYKTFSDHLSIGRLPGLQVCCFRIVAIAPAYAFLSWLKLMFLPALVVWKTLQDFCETYAIYCYWVMLIIWCGGQKHVIERLQVEETDRQTCSLCPLLAVYFGKSAYGCPMYSFRSSKGRFKFWRFSMTQLMVVRLGMNLLKMCLLILGFKGPGKVVHFIGLVSTALAMHCIIETYVALRLQLEHFQAEKKFICIKILVGIALLQPLLTNALETVGAFPDDVLYGYSSRKVSCADLTLLEDYFFNTSDTRLYLSFLPLFVQWSQRVLGTVSVIQMVVFSLLLSFAFSLKYTLRDQAADKSESDLDGSDAEHKL